MKARPATTSLPQMMSTLSDPVRLRMLRLLASHELTVGEIAQVLQLPQSSASRQLKVLSDADWLIRRSEGTATHYRLVKDELPELAAAIWGSVRDAVASLEDNAEDDRRVAGVLAERRTDSVNYFGRVKGEWDQIRTELFGARFTSTALLSLLRPDWVVADIGCGTGNVAELLSPVVEKVVAIDRSAPMLAAARKRLAGRRNVEFVEAAMGKLPLAARSLDAAVSMLILHHVDDVGAALADAARTLRPSRGGGVLSVVDMVPHTRHEYRHTMGHLHSGFSRKQMLGLFAGAGFEQCMYHELPAEPEARGPGLFVASGRIR
jgi:ArsR family transcriptional regulator